jgi:two-component system, NarL family, response regulator NreC
MTHLHLASAPTPYDMPSTEAPIPVVLADDHAVVRRGLRVLLDDEEDMDVIAEAEDLPSTVRQVYGHRPCVLVLDLRMPGGSSLETIRNLRHRAPDTRVVVPTMDDNPMFAQHALAAGALGYVLKEFADEELPSAVRMAAQGDEYVSPRVASRLHALQHSRTHDELTVREVEVLRLLSLGHTSVEIAAQLQISRRTVESHRVRIHSKLASRREPNSSATH